MRDELAFHNHLTRLTAPHPETGYRPPAPTGGPVVSPTASPATALRMLDLQA